MKKLMNRALAGLAAASMIASMGGMNVFAADTKTANVTFTVPQSYEWSIHSDIVLTDVGEVTTGNMVSVTKNIIPYGKVLEITYEMTNLTCKTNPDCYVPSLQVDHLNSRDAILQVPAGTQTGSVDVKYCNELTTIDLAGTYTGTITYTASVVDAGK